MAETSNMPSNTNNHFPDKLALLIEQNLASSLQLKAHIESLAGTSEAASPSLQRKLWSNVIKTHTSNLLTHNTILNYMSSSGLQGDAEATRNMSDMLHAGQEMIKASRRIQEYAMVSRISQMLKPVNINPDELVDNLRNLQVEAEGTSGKKKQQPAPKPRQDNYKKPSVQISDEDDGNEARGLEISHSVAQEGNEVSKNTPSDAPAITTTNSSERRKKKLKKRLANLLGKVGVGSREDEAQETTETSTSQESSSSHRKTPTASIPFKLTSKRDLALDDGMDANTSKKRIKFSPESVSSGKRKSDISMIDAGSTIPSPNSKRHKSDSLAEEPQFIAPPVQEYEDITAEVDAKMREHELRKERERKKELGIVDKRKRRSNDSFEVELRDVQHAAVNTKNAAEAESLDKRAKKKRKHKHRKSREDVGATTSAGLGDSSVELKARKRSFQDTDST